MGVQGKALQKKLWIKCSRNIPKEEPFIRKVIQKGLHQRSYSGEPSKILLTLIGRILGDCFWVTWVTKSVFSREWAKPWFFCGFYMINKLHSSQAFYWNLSSRSENMIWRFSSSILFIFVIFFYFRLFFCYIKTTDISIQQMISAVY